MRFLNRISLCMDLHNELGKNGFDFDFGWKVVHAQIFTGNDMMRSRGVSSTA